VDEVVGRDIVEAYGGRICVTSQRPGVSTTAILAAARRGE
jgi:bifunctional ADP-heptose synthase (sugar kinase/adenylyltransferase)